MESCVQLAVFFMSSPVKCIYRPNNHVYLRVIYHPNNLQLNPFSKPSDNELSLQNKRKLLKKQNYFFQVEQIYNRWYNVHRSSSRSRSKIEILKKQRTNLMQNIVLLSRHTALHLVSSRVEMCEKMFPLLEYWKAQADCSGFSSGMSFKWKMPF